jgi:hypothetical protein
VVERRDESLGQVVVWSTQLRVERIRRHQERPGETLGGLVVVRPGAVAGSRVGGSLATGARCGSTSGRPRVWDVPLPATLPSQAGAARREQTAR